MNLKMSNNLYLTLFFLVYILCVTASGNLYAATAYDENGEIVEILDFDYERYNFIEGQVIEYFDFKSSENRYGVIEEFEDDFSIITLKIIDNKTKKARKLIINIEQ